MIYNKLVLKIIVNISDELSSSIENALLSKGFLKKDEGYNFCYSNSHLHINIKKDSDKLIFTSSTIFNSEAKNIIKDTILAIFNRKSYLVSTNNLSKKYKINDYYSLKDVNININPSDIIGLLGHNGAGKSTLIKTIVGQEEITSGDVHILGINTDANPDFVKNFIGYIPDHYILFDELTGRQYVNYIADMYEVPNDKRRQLINHYLRIFHLENSFDSKIATYSFGMKQKITIISTLIHEPKILLLDEPLTGLDPDSIIEVKKCIIEEAAKGKAIIISSHLIDLIQEIANKIIVLKKGEVIYNTSLENALKEYHDDLNEMYLEKVGGVI